eukprot:CCRYP_004455-RA/>CCRYP_004455-RA protein AED:0.44 eAED:0.44 QI:0/-1/0/1/-1/1/1/0/239
MDQVGSYGIISAEKKHHVPLDYNSHKSFPGPVRFEPLVPHSSTGAGGDRMVYATRSLGNRHRAVDYNSQKFISDSEASVDAAKFVSRSLTGTGEGSESSRIRLDGPVDYNSHKFISGSVRSAPFVPHSSICAAGNRMMSATDSLGDRHSPADYNSHKFISHSEASVDAIKFGSRSLISTGGAPISRRIQSNGPVDYNYHKSMSARSVGAAPFVPHSSTGAGGAAMSPSSPSYRATHRPQ